MTADRTDQATNRPVPAAEPATGPSAEPGGEPGGARAAVPAARAEHTPVRGELRQVADGVHVWRPLPGVGWGLANCGLLTASSSAAWIDTPYDRTLADQFLALSRPLLAEGTDIDWLLVTHGNGDHLWGWEAVPDARVVYTSAAAAHIAHEPDPCDLHRLVHDTDPNTLVGWYLGRHFGRYRWPETSLPQPALTFSGEVEIAVGETPVQLTQLPPAHTTGDLIAYLPRQRVCFSGDIVFAATAEEAGDHPVHWAGPLENVIDGCDRVLATGATVFVPGHGPILDRDGVLGHRDYLCHLRDRVHDLHAAGIPAGDAARIVATENHYPALHLRERLSITVGLQYRHLDAAPQTPMLQQMLALAQLAWELERPGVPLPS